MQQIFLQNATATLLQNATDLLQIATFITNCDDFITKCGSYYKMRRLLKISTGHSQIEDTPLLLPKLIINNYEIKRTESIKFWGFFIG